MERSLGSRYGSLEGIPGFFGAVFDEARVQSIERSRLEGDMIDIDFGWPRVLLEL